MRAQMWFNRDGTPITSEEADALLATPGYKRVAVTNLGDVRVSTIWLALDHRWTDEGAPLIFETMAFGDEGEEVRRYSTEEEAKAGHIDVVACIRRRQRWGRLAPFFARVRAHRMKRIWSS